MKLPLRRQIHSVIPVLRLAISVTIAALVASVVSRAEAQPELAPRIVFDRASGTGLVVRAPKQPADSMTVAITDSVCDAHLPGFPASVLPRQSRVTFQWHAEPVVPGSHAVEYQYFLDDSVIVTVDSTVHSVSYDLVGPAIHTFTIRVTDEHGFTREARRCFRLGLGPDSWIAGPDLALLDARFGWTNGHRALHVADWSALPDLSGTMFSCDSLTRWPAERPPRKTFFEIYGDSIFVRSEGDTVHYKSFVFLGAGGSDLDSPYDVLVAAGDPALADTLVCGPHGEAKVVRAAGVVGSPVAFRSRSTVKMTPYGSLLSFPASGAYPNFDPFSPFRKPTIGFNPAAIVSGKWYVSSLAIDGDGFEDGLAGSAVEIADRVDAGLGTPEEIALRRKILTFYVNQDPYLLFDAPGFSPVPGQTFTSRTLSFNLLADNPDPYEEPEPFGGPSSIKRFRRRVHLDGLDSNGQPVGYDAPYIGEPSVEITMPDEMVGPDVTVRVELCDCDYCELYQGSGRCVDVVIPIRVPATITPALGSLIAASARPDGVSLRWRLPYAGVARVERRTAATEWRVLGDTRVNAAGEAVYEDAAVAPGTRYGYRAAFTSDGAEAIAGETWIDVPSRFELALEGLRPNPAKGSDLTIHLSLPTSSGGRLELIDVSGRRWVDRDLGGFGAGRHVIRLGAAARVPPGVYLIRLTQGERTRVTRGAVLE